MKKINSDPKRTVIGYIEDHIYQINRYEQYLKKLPLESLDKIEEYLLKSVRIIKKDLEIVD